jgi:hypothetical protein
MTRFTRSALVFKRKVAVSAASDTPAPVYSPSELSLDFSDSNNGQFLPAVGM